MSTTINSIINSALRKINVIQPGETASSTISTIAVEALDSMLDSWSNNNLMIYNRDEYIFKVIAGQQSYQFGPCKGITTFGNIVPGSGYVDGSYSNVPIVSLTGQGGAGTPTNLNAVKLNPGQGALATVTVLGGVVTAIKIAQNKPTPGSYTNGAGFGYDVGDLITVSNTNVGGFGSGFTATVTATTGGDWATIRPVEIEVMKTMWNSGASNQILDITIDPMTFKEYSDLQLKSLPSSFSLKYYNDGDFPVSNVKLFPIPMKTMNVRLFLRSPLLNFSNLNDVVQFPPGYARALIYALAVELAPEFGKELTPEIIEISVASKDLLGTINMVPRYMTGEGTLTGGASSGGLQSIYTIWANT